MQLVHGYLGLVAMLLDGKVGGLSSQSDETQLEAVHALNSIIAHMPPAALAALCRSVGYIQITHCQQHGVDVDNGLFCSAFPTERSSWPFLGTRSPPCSPLPSLKRAHQG